MGGKESKDFLAPTGSGENELMRCENGDYFADAEAASGAPPPAELPPALDAPELVDTPGVGTIDELVEFLSDRGVGDVEGAAGGDRRPARARARAGR